MPSPIRRVVILGMGLSIVDYVSRSYLENQIEGDTQIWAINSAGFTFVNDLTISAHTKAAMLAENKLTPSYAKIGRIVTLDDWGFGNSEEYPLAEVIERYGDNYLNNSVAYAIALAMLCDVEVLELFGCDYNYEGSTAYEHGRGNVEYWLGRAAQSGIQVNLGQNTLLMDIRKRMALGMYGFTRSEQPTFEMEDGRIKLMGFTQLEN